MYRIHEFPFYEICGTTKSPNGEPKFLNLNPCFLLLSITGQSKGSVNENKRTKQYGNS